MTNPTSNFGWQMPTPTDLVTDLPADFEVFGQAVDTSMADLKGGTTGQILSKATNTDMDFTWITNDVGDITAVNVTSPITGGGSSGAVTIGVSAASTSASGVVQLSDSTSTTSSVLASTPTATKSAYDLANAAIAKSTVTTAGDIIYRNATVPTRLGIGTAGQVLAVNSGATAPEWTTPSGATTLPTFSAYANTNQSFSAATWTKITFGTEEWDTNTNFASSRFTPTVAGYYVISGRIDLSGMGAGAGATTYLAAYKNGTIYKNLFSMSNQYTSVGFNGSTTIYLNGSSDYVELYTYMTSGTPLITAGQEATWFNGVGVRA
jgi:hypothetical protein